MKTQYSARLEKWFTNKAEYLEWRAAWRAHYALMAEEIRECKQLRKTAPDPEDRGHAQYRRQQLRAEAAGLMEIRKNSKLEAQRQYLAAKAAATAC